MVESGAGKLLARAAQVARLPLVANAGYIWGVTLVSSVVGFVFWALAARFYTPDEVGLASAVISAAALVAGIASLGMGIGLVRFLPEARDPSRLLNSVLLFGLVSSLVIALAYAAGLPLWSPALLFLRRDLAYLLVFLAYVLVTVLTQVVRVAFIARRRAVYGLGQTLILNGARLALIIPFAVLGDIGLVGSVLAGSAVALVVSAACFLPRVEPGFRLRPRLNWADLRPLIPYSAGNYVAGLASQSVQMVLPLLTLELLGAGVGGRAYVAWMVGSFLTSPGVALAGSAFAEGSNLPREFRGTLLRAAGLAMLVTLPLSLVVGLAAPWLLRLGFGVDYAREAAGLLRWLAAAAPLAVLAQLYFSFLRVRKHVGRLVALSCVVGAATLGAAVLWMPRPDLLVGDLLVGGISAGGIGWLAGNGLVVLFAALDLLGRREPAPGALEAEGVSLPMENPLVVAALPCYNEAHFIEDVARRALAHVDVVVVVDDGSTDATVELARRAGAQVVEHRENRGPGAAARSCLQAGRDLQAGVLVTLDGDGQHDPDEIPDVIAPLLSGEADVVIGSRFLGRANNVARYRRFGIDVITFLYNAGARVRITDGQSCFRAYNRRALETLRITEPGFGFSVETLVQARHAGLRLHEVSISCVYHAESHSMNPVIHGLGVALMVVKHRVLAGLGLSPDGRTRSAGGQE